MKKVLFLLLIIMVVFTIVFSGCSENSKNNESSNQEENNTNEDVSENQENNEEEAKEEGLNINDMSEKIDIELLQKGWLNTPRTEEDPYQKWIDETYNVNFKLTSTAEFATEYTVRFASDDMPDIVLAEKNQMEILYDQGMLLEDWNKYLEYMPTVDNNIDDAARKLFTQNDNLIALPGLKEPEIWTIKIRKDWMEELNVDIPKTVDELIEVAKDFTYGDPDNNGEDDTYAFTSAGGGESLGEIEELLGMFGPSDFYIAKDGTVKHPVIDGNLKKFYDFMRTIVEEELIEPNWYTQGWQERKAELFKGKLGIVWYPGALVNETEGGTGNTGETIDWYESIPMPKGSEIGGKRKPMPIYSTLKSVSIEAAEDKTKLARIIRILEDTSYPNDGFWALRWGVGVDGFTAKELENGYKYIDVLGKEGEHYRGSSGNLGAWDWGTWIGTRADLVIEGTTPDVTDATYKMIKEDTQAKKMPTYSTDFYLLDLDTRILENLKKIKLQFEINYILGKEDGYEEFKEDWLEAGGNELLEEAKKQYKEYGLLD